MKRIVIAALCAFATICLGLIAFPAPLLAAPSDVTTSPVRAVLGMPQVGVSPKAVPMPNIMVPKAPNSVFTHTADCVHGCYATDPICVIQATTWGPLQTMWARWWYASYSVVGEFRSPQAGCADYPPSRTFVFSAFDDPNYNSCWKWENLGNRAPDGHWNSRVTVYMNWGIASCRTNQVEIEHRTGAAIGYVLGVPIWASNNSPWTYCINNMTEWSIANINQLTTWCGQRLWPMYGQHV